MREEKQLTEKESLALITSMISKAKNSSIDSGIGPLFWGVLITICSLVTFAETKFNVTLGFDIWLISMIAVLPQIFFTWRAKKEKVFIPHDETMMNYVWGTFAICVFMLSFYTSQTHTSNGIALYMMVFGIPTFITGGIRNFKPMILGGLICWICSITSYYVSFPNGMLLMALSAVAAWLLPGIILRRRYLKMKNV